MTEYNRAWQLTGQLRAQEAIPLLRRIIEKDKTFYRAYRTLTEAYHQEGALDKAEQYFGSLAADDPENGRVHYAIAGVRHAETRLAPTASHPAALPDILVRLNRDAVGLAGRGAPRHATGGDLVAITAALAGVVSIGPRAWRAGAAMSWSAHARGPDCAGIGAPPRAWALARGCSRAAQFEPSIAAATNDGRQQRGQFHASAPRAHTGVTSETSVVRPRHAR